MSLCMARSQVQVCFSRAFCLRAGGIGFEHKERSDAPKGADKMAQLGHGYHN